MAAAASPPKGVPAQDPRTVEEVDGMLAQLVVFIAKQRILGEGLHVEGAFLTCDRLLDRRLELVEAS